MIIELKTEMAVKEPTLDGRMLCSPDAVNEFLGDLREFAQETFVVVTLNSKNRVIRRHLVSIGTVSSALVHPRECFRPAILDGASAVILAHNHPSGDTCPSSEDLKITRQLINAGQHIGIKVFDHVIIGDGMLSIRESGLCDFNSH